MDWKKTIASVAPILGTALGGPFGGMAAKLVTSALGLPEDVADKEIEKALQANPEALLKLKTAELELTAKLKEMDVRIEQLVYEDIANARNREIQTRDSFTPRVLALLITFGFFGVLGWLLAVGKPTDGGDALLIMLGGLGTAWAGIVTYYFGSSASSARKTDMLEKVTK